MNGDELNPDGTPTGNDFWGTTPDWTDTARRPRGERSAGRADVTGAIKSWWNSAMGGGVEGTREHRIIDASADQPAEPESGIDLTMFDDLDTEIPLSSSGRVEVSDVAANEAGRALPMDDRRLLDPPPLDPTVEIPVVDATVPAAGFDEMMPVAMVERDNARKDARRNIDPLLVRIGAVAVVTTLLIPLMMGLTSGDDGDDTVASASIIEVPPPTLVDPVADSVNVPVDTAVLDPDSLAPAVPVDPPTSVESTGSAESPAEPSGTSSTRDDGDVITVGSGKSAIAAGAVETSASADKVADRTQNCAVTYEVQPLDFWIRLAEGADVPLAGILEANNATTSTPLYPGTTICLPAGASTPQPVPAPTTAEPTTAAVPAPTTAVPAPTTAAPTTVAPSSAGPEDVKQIIRDVWPDELEERALEIAFRESRYVPTAKNFCCYGIFQMYWNVHKSWLADIGITNDQQLYDPATNARAAYALYQRAGGWGPWAL